MSASRITFSLDREQDAKLIARLDELARSADAFSLMLDGRIAQTGRTPTVLADSEALSAAGLSAPLSVRLSQALVKKGWPLAGADTSTPQRLVAALQELNS